MNLFNRARLCALSLLFFSASAMAVVDDEAKSFTTSESVPGEFIVKLRNNSTQDLSPESLGRILGGIVKSRFNGDPNLIVLKKDARVGTKRTLDELNGLPGVQYAEPNYIYQIQKAPNDPDYGQMWGFHNAGDSANLYQNGIAGVDINIEKAWDLTTGSNDVIVGVIDTGIDLNHPDLQANIWANDKELNGKPGVDDDGNGFVDDIHGYNFYDDIADPMDDNGHGSHVAGIIGAHGNDGAGIAGANWNVKLMAVKFLSAAGTGTLEGAVKAIDYATSMGARVTNNSWGGKVTSQALEDAISRAEDKGVLFVAAAGNSSQDNDQQDAFPANIKATNVLAVASVNNQGELSYFSNWGAKNVAVAAPGEKIWSCFKGGSYKSLSGTSMASPHVAGLAALMLSHEDMNYKELKKRITASCRPLAALKGKVQCGGIVDAFKALGK